MSDLRSARVHGSNVPVNYAPDGRFGSKMSRYFYFVVEDCIATDHKWGGGGCNGRIMFGAGRELLNMLTQTAENFENFRLSCGRFGKFSTEELINAEKF